eukprot:3679762-Alexandrium_andersonii.AAC.1
MHRCAPARPPGSRARCLAGARVSAHARPGLRACGRLAPRAPACAVLLVLLVRTCPHKRPPCASLPSGLPCTS